MIAWGLWIAVAGAACPAEEGPELLVIADPPLLEDRLPPSGPEVIAVRFEEAEGADGCEACGDYLVLEIDLEPGQDEDTPAGEVGVQAIVLTGELPAGVVLPEAPFLGPTARFVWEVPRGALLEEIDLLLELRSVDRAGNVSGESLEVSITRAALPAVLTGCTQGGRAAPAALAALLLLLGRRRERTVAG